MQQALSSAQPSAREPTLGLEELLRFPKGSDKPRAGALTPPPKTACHSLVSLIGTRSPPIHPYCDMDTVQAHRAWGLW